MIPDAVPILFEAALRALAAAFILWAGLRLLRVENVPAQKAAWGLVLAAALAMPLLMRIPLLPSWAAIRIPAPAWHRTAQAAPAPAPAVVRLIAAPAARQEAAETETQTQTHIDADDVYRFSAPAASTSQKDAEPRSTPAVLTLVAPATRVSSPAVSNSRQRLEVYAWLAYLCVTAALLLRLLMGLCSSLRLWIQAEPVETAAELELPAAIAVRASRRIASPVNIGSGIVLPADYTNWDAEKLRVVLAHEHSHVRQRDFYLQLAAGLYAAITWFSPLGWWLRRKLSELGEAISDRAGMEAAASPSAYAQLLLEFAALPRPAFTGVAMAHSSNLSERIERLLNDSSFHRAFTGGRRALLVLVPAVLFATAALVRVQAAQLSAQPAAVLQAAAPAPSAAQSSDRSPASASSQDSSSGQSHPDQAQVTDDAPPPPAPPQTPPAPQAAPQPAPASANDAEPAPAPAPPVPPTPSIDVVVPVPPVPEIHVEVPVPPVPGRDGDRYHYAYHYTDGDPYVIVGDAGNKSRYSGDWDGERQADIDKARAMAHGHFLLFRHDGKTYLIDDPAVMSEIESMQKPMEALGDQMRDLGKQMREEGQQQREEARKARQTAENIPTPDLTKQMAELDAAVAALKSEQGGTVTREQLTEIQRKLSEVQRQLINSEIRVNVTFDKDFMSTFGAEQGKFGQQMGQFGKQMGEMARENDQKIKSIIDQSLKDGKAKPVN
ncbi:MAG: M56 family metallopeptidase [Terracidiphilus sp.]|jgi:beta-lactamase regulating signal transducer with metallopeptidase domain